jgi:flavin reductase (DIM6/NTAB) family NADH-FMN oxidoreductase RutF
MMAPASDATPESAALVPLSLGRPIWDRFFAVAPLVLVGTREGEGYDLAPKHLAMPLGWEDRYAFVCTPRHATYRNVLEHRAFTVSFPTAEQIVGVSLAAAPRADDGAKLGLAALPTFPARAVDGVLVEGCRLHLECELDRVVDGFGDASLVVGRIVAAWADEASLRSAERDDADLIHRRGVLAYLAPGRFADVRDSRSFPYPVDFSR